MISEDLGHKLEKVELGQLGSVKKVTVTKDDTIMLHGAGEGREGGGRGAFFKHCREGIVLDEGMPAGRTELLSWAVDRARTRVRRAVLY